MAISPDLPITAGALNAHGIRKCVGKDDPIIVEVGANCGQTTLEILEAMPNATIYAFEPDQRAIAKFRSVIKHPHVHLYECAIGAKNGTISFNQSSGAEDQPGYGEGWDQSGSIRRPKGHLTQYPWVKFEEQITVPIMTLDTWSEQHKVAKADFVWADVQGAESDLVQGGARFLSASRYFYTEYSNDECYEGQISLPGLLEMLPNFELILRFEMDALLRNTSERHEPLGRITYPQIQL